MTTTPNTKPVLILMADDDPEDCLLTKKTLQKARLANELRFVQDGQELLDYLGRSGKFSDPGSSPRPDLILLDLNMPNMAGLDSLWEINLKPALRKIPIVILTASEASLDISDSYNLGAYAYLVKPVTFTKLHEAVLRLKSCSYELTVPAGPGDAVRPAVIVMADDDPEDCLQATKTLQAAGLGNALTYVTNGAALLDHLQGRHVHGDGSPAPRPDLVILDPGLQQTEGRHALAEIAASPALRDLPVILLGRSRDDRADLPWAGTAEPVFIETPIDFIAFAGAVAAFQSLALRLVTKAEGPAGTAGAA